MKLKQLNKLMMRGVMVFFALLPLLATAQSKYTFKGSIKDASTGEGLIGATVNIGGTFQGAAADENGMYDLSGAIKPGRYSLIFNYVGYTAKVVAVEIAEAGGTQTIDAELGADAMNLDQVVVTGSTLSSTRRQLGNAITNVDGAALSKSGTGNALAALAGRVPGARITQTSGDPAGGINVNLRGINSIKGGSEPLYVIDGVVVSNASTNVSQTAVDAGEASLGTNRLADLNPNDIENISILNGAAAAAIYGSRAANGVVMITTKRGSNGKPKITVGTSVTMNSLRKKVYITTYGKQFGSDKLALNTIGSINSKTAYPNLVLDTFARNGADQYLAKNLVDVVRRDYQDDIFQDAMGTDNFINVSGGTDKTKYFVGMSYMKNGGIIKNTDFNRYGLRMNLDQQLTNWATVSVGLNYTNSLANEKPNGNVFFSPINSMTITNNIYDINALDTLGNYQVVDPGRVNPLTVLNTFDITNRVNRTTNNLKLSLFPISGLKIDFIAGIDAFSQIGSQYIPIYPYTVNAVYKSSGFAGTANNSSFLYNNDINATYEKTFGKISSTTTVGYNYQHTRTDYANSFGENLIPGITTVNASAARQTSYTPSKFDVSGYFAQQTFGYDNSLFLTLAGRVDNSSVFSKEQGNQFYPRASVSYILSDLWKNNNGLNKIINTAKLRGSFGEAGGLTAIGAYDRFYAINPVAYLGKSTLVPSAQRANEFVAPERTREIEFGIDLGLLNNKVTVGATYYTQKVFDLLVDRVISSAEGGTSLIDNVGEMENKGIELSVNVNPIKTKNINWDIYGIFNNNKNKIVKLGSPLVALSNVAGAPAYLIEGQPSTVFFTTYYAANPDGSQLVTTKGLPQTEKGIIVPYKAGDAIIAGATVIAGSQYVPLRGKTGKGEDAQPTPLNTRVTAANGLTYTVTELRKVTGNPNPDYTLTWGTNFTWKKLTFGLMLDGAYGMSVFNADKRTRQGVGIGNVAEQEYKNEIKRGTINAIYPIEEWRLDDGSYTKLREVSLSYNFGGLVKGMSDMTISVIGRNLYSFDNYNGYDPETNAGGTSDRLRGIDFGNIPIPRTVQFALKASF